MSAWQSAQAWSPTNVAPSMDNGTTTSRSGVEQELKMSIPATAYNVKPASHPSRFILTSHI
jgi:hypothetical protein